MKKLTWMLTVAMALTLVPAWYACEREADDDDDNEATHNVGNNCLQCHKAGGGGEGVFTAGGSVFKSGTNTGAAGALVRLYDNPEGNGVPVVSMTADVGGNFHTSSPINFGTGLWAKVTYNGSVTSMITPVTQGGCNSCHGPVIPKIEVQ